MSAESQTPTVINLNHENCVKIIIQYVELAQQKGAFLLQEAELLKRAIDVSTIKIHDEQINEASALQLLTQGIHKGQRHGSFTLNDAALLSKVMNFLASNPTPTSNPTPSQTQPVQANETDDLSELSQPVPLKPREI